MTDTAHPESYGHWDHSQISDLLHERDRLRELLEAYAGDAADIDDKAETLADAIRAALLHD